MNHFYLVTRNIDTEKTSYIKEYYNDIKKL